MCVQKKIKRSLSHTNIYVHTVCILFHENVWTLLYFTSVCVRAYACACECVRADDGAGERRGRRWTNRTVLLLVDAGTDGWDRALCPVRRTLSRPGRTTAGEKQFGVNHSLSHLYWLYWSCCIGLFIAGEVKRPNSKSPSYPTRGQNTAAVRRDRPHPCVEKCPLISIGLFGRWWWFVSVESVLSCSQRRVIGSFAACQVAIGWESIKRLRCFEVIYFWAIGVFYVPKLLKMKRAL